MQSTTVYTFITFPSFLKNYINNLRYADDITLMAEGEEELKSLLMNVKVETDKAVLKLSILKTKIVGSGAIASWQVDGKQWKQ